MRGESRGESIWRGKHAIAAEASAVVNACGAASMPSLRRSQVEAEMKKRTRCPEDQKGARREETWGGVNGLRVERRAVQDTE